MNSTRRFAIDVACPAALALAAAALVLGSLSSGCGSERRDAPFTEPLNLSDPQVALGQRVFATHCHQCHPGGAAGLGPAINDKPLPVNVIKTQVRQSLFGTMPKFPPEKISDDELDALVKYVKGLRNLEQVAGR
jgi:mono/diheme cytochrome c family protein